VAGDVAATSMRDESANRYQVYEPFNAGILPAQVPLWVVGRTARGTGPAIASISSMLRSLDRSITISRATTGDGLIHDALAGSRFYALVLAAFALLALVLAAVGLFGVLSYGVQQQSRDIGIRMALGARAGDVQRGVVVRALLPVAAGLGVGIGLSFVATRVLASLLYGVRPIDPPTLAGVTLIMLITGLLASYLPARTAARVDPVRTLRAE
jgi:putative ABC transport system permease protein